MGVHSWNWLCQISKQHRESSVWWHFYHPKTLKNNGVNHRWKSPLRALSPTVPSALLSPQLSHVTYTHLLNPSIHLHWLQGQGLHNSSGSLIFGLLKLNMCQLDWTAQLEEHLISLWPRVRVLLKMQVQLSGSVPPCAVKGRAWGLSCAPFLQSSAELKLLEFWKIAFQLNSILHLILCCASKHRMLWTNRNSLFLRSLFTCQKHFHSRKSGCLLLV